MPELVRVDDRTDRLYHPTVNVDAHDVDQPLLWVEQHGPRLPIDGHRTHFQLPLRDPGEKTKEQSADRAPVGGPLKTEDDPLDPDPPRHMRRTLEAIRDLEDAVLGSDQFLCPLRGRHACVKMVLGEPVTPSPSWS